ncbi:hypothetical protein AVEN_271659-1 [Araneus ventricosus]|uniref:Uncharacterized protein n=1 Tax=Araneus ventricosus TaxID=182803 RepID=A0A4Y2S448_ARAVE|nr:hypothetical protein AVEN_271659-1 [Araneus ventricosus]
MLLRTCRSNLVGEVVHEKLSYVNLAAMVSETVCADSPWKVKWQPFRNLLCYLDINRLQYLLRVKRNFVMSDFVLTGFDCKNYVNWSPSMKPKTHHPNIFLIQRSYNFRVEY